MANRSVRFNTNQGASTKPTGSSNQQQQNKSQSMQNKNSKNQDDFDNYDDDGFDDMNQSPNGKQPINSKGQAAINRQSTTSKQNNNGSNNIIGGAAKIQKDMEDGKKIINFEDIVATNNTNRYIIYKFMKKGFTALSAEDLACTMVNPDFTIDFRKNTTEEWATQYQYKVVERLNKCKFNLQWVTRKQGGDDQFEPFFQMIKDGDLSRVVEFMRQSSIQTNEILDAVEKTSKKSPLHFAAAEGHTQMVEFLINKGARIDARDKLLRTALHLACQAGHATVVKLLLDNNADPYEKDQSGRTAMHYATCSTCVEQLTILCEHGPDLVHMKDHAGRTALHYTVFNSMTRQVEMALKLLNFGADVNALDNDRRTPLHHAAEAGKARIIPLLVQRGASTGTKDTLKGKTPLELASTDHIKELIIVHSSPNYVPKQDDLSKALVVDGNKMNIETEPYDMFGMKSNNNYQSSSLKQLTKPKINQKRPQEEQKYQDIPSETMYEGSVQYFKNPLGPPRDWEKQQDKFLPYNMKAYQERLVMFLKRVQEFGVSSYQHVKKPYLFTGSWMEYVRNMDDLMLQINGCRPNEAVMKCFNIFFPYDKPLPHGRGDELSLQDFYKGFSSQVNENRDCDPDVLKSNLENQADQELQNAMKNNGVDEIQDLLDIKRQLMALEQINSMHQITIQEKDERIRLLNEQLKNAQAQGLVNQKQEVNLMQEQQYLQILQENNDLKNQISSLTEYLNVSQNKLEELTKLLDLDDARKRQELDQLKNFSKLQELELAKNDLERELVQEKERNRALRFKAGQIFLSTLEKGGAGVNASKGKKGEGDYYLEDDDALMRLLQKIESLGEPGLRQRLIDAGEPDGTETILRSQFQNFLQKIGTTATDILSLERIVGFYDGGQPVMKMKVDDIMLKIKLRAEQRGKIERDTLQLLANEFKAKGMTIQDLFSFIDKDGEGTISFGELQNTFRTMKIELSIKDMRNIVKLFDQNGDNEISLIEFENQMSKYMESGKAKVFTDTNHISSNIIPEAMKEELRVEMNNEIKKKVEYEDFKINKFQANDFKQKEQIILDQIKRGTLPPEMINGEVRVQIEEGMNLISVTGKGIPIIGLAVTSYTDDGQKAVKQIYSPPCINFRQTNNFKTSVTLPMIKTDCNKVSDIISIQFYMQDDAANKNMETATFVGEISLPWKGTLSKENSWLSLNDALTDPSGKCTQKVSGVVKINARWIPAGSETSKYNVDGTKKEVAAPVIIPDKREQQLGTEGKLECYILRYTHPASLQLTTPSNDKYHVEVFISQTQSNRTQSQFPSKEDPNLLEFGDCKTLAINNIAKDRGLVIKLINSTTMKEVCKTVIDLVNSCYTKPNQNVVIKQQKMTIEGIEEKGTLECKLRFLDGTAPPKAGGGAQVAANTGAQKQLQQPTTILNSGPTQEQTAQVKALPQSEEIKKQLTKPVEEIKQLVSKPVEEIKQQATKPVEENKKQITKPVEEIKQQAPKPQDAMIKSSVAPKIGQVDNLFEEAKTGKGTQNMRDDDEFPEDVEEDLDGFGGDDDLINNDDDQDDADYQDRLAKDFFNGEMAQNALIHREMFRKNDERQLNINQNPLLGNENQGFDEDDEFE